ncbi:MAG: putative PLP-dependent enzyme involved in cell wall biosis [Myxococcaceae bacterium]|nr:putative PLP-dependent enzyme involved in cell wall biosis [Myxococcaceae bacterium]
MTKQFVHPTAVVDPGAELGEGVKVWHFSHVSEGAVIGAGSSLGQNVFIGRGVRVGARVKLQNNVSLYEGVEIADDVFLGPSCVFTNVVNPRAFVERKSEYRRTRVGTGASIGANATIVCGHDIGSYAFIAAGATVTHEVPAYALVMGTPARRTAWICRCGEKLPAASLAICSACGARYRTDAQQCVPEAEAALATLPGAIEVPLLDLGAQNTPLRTELRAAFERVLSSNQFILGPEVERFESALESHFGFAHAIAVSSGTDALLLALMALGIGAGDEVITSTFSFFATAGCIARVGATPVFVDIDPRSFNLDTAHVEAALSARTKAILPVHLFGQTADLSSLSTLATRHGVALIEDAAQALGATQHGAQAGSVGAFGCFSFFPSKNLGGFGDGGLVVTQEAALADKARVLRSHGGKPKYHHQLIGGNFRLDALQAALLCVKLPELARYARARRANAQFYDQQLAGLASHGLVTPVELAPPGHVYNQYVVRTPRRDALRAALSEAHIGSEVYYPRCLHEQPCFAALGKQRGDFPEAERAADEVLALPIYPELRAEQRERVVQAITNFFSASRA